MGDFIVRKSLKKKGVKKNKASALTSSLRPECLYGSAGRRTRSGPEGSGTV